MALRKHPRSREGGTPRIRRNPPAKPEEFREALTIARDLAVELDPTRRASVVVAGSWVRGDAHAGSDIDLWLVGTREQEMVRERGGRLVSVSFSTLGLERRRLRDPARLGGAVPGWRSARILRDPTGVARRLQSEARKFRWSSVRAARDRYVAQQLAEWTEEVAKLLRALETRDRETASAQRNLIANRMGFLRSLQLEFLYGTENGLWERVGTRAGPSFRAAQRAALGTDGSDWRASCEAALRLYSITARASLPNLTGDRRRIVLAAGRRAGYPIGAASPDRR